MAVKLLMTWDVIPGKEQEYFEFVGRELVPGMQRRGIHPPEAWLTTYGERPQILTGGVTESIEDMQKALSTSDWSSLRTRLLDYVTNFDSKVVLASGGFQM